ncbi:MAG: hypothetical protein KDE03_01795 [Rhodobacteraceae bacterium]|nr:hypothetical protein [Paracoccaceae bacterium]
MSVEEVRGWFEFVAVVVGVLVALATLFTQVSKAIEKYLTHRESQKAGTTRQRLLVTPSPEEFARYSVKNVQDTRKEEEQYIAELQRRAQMRIRGYLEYTNHLSTRTQARIFTLGLMFLICFLSLAIYFTLLTYGVV